MHIAKADTYYKEHTMAILNKKCGTSHEPTEGYQMWKNALNLLGMNVHSMKFAKDGKLKEICANQIWYTVNQYKRFSAFVRNLMKKKIKEIQKFPPKLPKWATFKPYMLRVV